MRDLVFEINFSQENSHFGIFTKKQIDFLSIVSIMDYANLISPIYLA
jgi:hypothetical protein